MKTTTKSDYGMFWEQMKKGLLAVAEQLSFFALGLFGGNATFLQSLSPFGIAATAAAPLGYLFSTAAGAFFSYFLLLLRGGAFRYLAALTAVVLIRVILKTVKADPKNAFTPLLTAFGVTLCTGLVTAGNSFSGVMLAVCEALLTGGAAYFIHTATQRKGPLVNCSGQELTALVITLGVALMGLFPLTVFGVSPGRCLGVVLIFAAARYGRASAGAVAGVVMGCVVALAGGGVLPAFICAVGGMLAGALAPLGKLAAVLSFAVAGFAGTVLDAISAPMVTLLVEIILGAVVFLLLPKALLVKVAAIFSPPAELTELAGLRKTMVMRLRFAAGALTGVSKTIDEIGQRLSQRDAPNFDTVLGAVEQDACRGCSLCTHCWERSKSETVEALLAMSDALRHAQPIQLADLPIAFAERCLRRERVENALAVHYGHFSSHLAAEKRITEMREVVADQFAGISDMLEDLAGEIDCSQSYDTQMADKVVAALAQLGIHAAACGCVLDKFDRMQVEIRLREAPSLPFNRSRVLSVLEDVCERELEPPGITRVGNEYYITICEKAVYAVDYAVCSHTSAGKQICGDTAECFYDGRGHLCMIISDGMGTGGRAAVDSAMASGLMGRLLKAGFGYDCSLRIVNSAMLFKSTDESLATVDITAIDLFTGCCSLYKAGAAPTLVRRSGRTGRAECKSLPAGILREVGFDRATVTLKAGDIVLMLSDGAVNDGTDWICAELESFRDGTARQLAERILQGARRRRSDGHEDDITVLAAILDRAV